MDTNENFTRQAVDENAEKQQTFTGEVSSLSFGRPDPEDSDAWIDDGITYITIALDGSPRLGAGRVEIRYITEESGARARRRFGSQS